MATLTTGWANYAAQSEKVGNATVTFYIDAYYSSQDIEANTTTIHVRLNTLVSSTGTGGSGYKFTCSYCPTQEGSDVWYFADETITSGSGTITHNANGKKSITLSATMYNKYWGLNSSMSCTVDLPDIPRQASITTAPNFNDEENPILKYSNPAGTSATTLQACIANTDGSTIWVPYRDIEKSGSSYTFNLTSAERATLRGACPNSNSLKFKYYIKTVIGSNTFYTPSDTKEMSIVNANPTVSLAVQETNTKVISLLGSSTTKIIKNISNLQATATASGNKSATIKSVVMNNGAQSSGSSNPYTFNAVTNGTITATATDSRGNTSTATKAFANDNIINYIYPNIISSEFSRVALDSNSIVLNAEIECYTGSFNDTANAITITYEGTNGKSGTISSYVKSNNKIEITDLALGDLVTSAEEVPTFTLKIKDTFGEDDSSNVIISIVPPIDIGQSDVQINGDLFIADKKGQNAVNILELLYPVGAVYLSTQNTSPATIFAGTSWTRIGSGYYFRSADSSETAKDTGGSGTSGSTTLTAAQSGVPAHTHTTATAGNHEHGVRLATASGSNASYFKVSGSGNVDGWTFWQGGITWAAGDHSHSVNSNTAAAASSGHTHSITPKYFKVYAWYRTA